ncbi:MAG: shikimate kinase [Micavibrio aeruginosavorus]|uniref:Shikimate kinase n=1 Tax=Micavibrio aeruginosavorus TaxID=349221 RepID=A0A2W5FHR3_9BACT|nr:MAG: shikimate kinase [Micavibrio aeruginosavorus]
MEISDQIQYINDHLSSPIVIIGMMGAGKTTLGRKLAEKLGWEFVDSDIEIEREQGISVKDIFETKGEAAFRSLEKEKISKLLDTGHKILSAGGGAITTPETAQKIFTRSISLWIDAPVKTLAKRTIGTGTRPLLAGRDPEEALSERMEQRRHLYQKASLRVDGSADINTVLNKAIGQIYDYLIQNPHGI